MSRASQITAFSPILNSLPDSTLHVTVGDSLELSLASGLGQETLAVDCPGLVTNDRLLGHEIIVGASTSVNQDPNLNC